MPPGRPSPLADLIDSLAHELGRLGAVHMPSPRDEIHLLIPAGREHELGKLEARWARACRRPKRRPEEPSAGDCSLGEVCPPAAPPEGADISLVVTPWPPKPGYSRAVIAWHGPEAEEYSGFLRLRSEISGGREAYYDPVADEMVTPGYVGPDRRSGEHRLRFLLRGRRTKNAPGLPQADYFSDRMMPRLRPVVSFLMGLSLIDGLATCVWLVTGTAEEANPLLRVSLFGGLPIFLLVKVSITLALIGVLVFFQHFRFMRVIIPATVGVYLALLAYHARIWLASFPEAG